MTFNLNMNLNIIIYSITHGKKNNRVHRMKMANKRCKMEKHNIIVDMKKLGHLPTIRE